jgi:opacity protein-like surface antigen
MVNRIFIFLVISLACVEVNAQYKGVEVKISGSYPLINDIEQPQTIGVISASTTSGYTQTTANIGSIQENYTNSLGFSAESKVHFSLSKRLAISIGVGVQHAKFKREEYVEGSESTTVLVLSSNLNFNIDSTQNGIISGYSFQRDVDGNLIIDSEGFPVRSDISDLIIGAPTEPPVTIYYLEIPLGISFNLTKKIESNLGVSLAQRIYSKTKGEVITYDLTSGVKLVEETYTDGRGFNSTQLFLSAGIAYNIWKNIFTSISYKRSMTPIYNTENQIAGKARYNFFGLGLSYRFQKPVPNI